MNPGTLDIYANGWGITKEHIVKIPQWEWDSLKRFRKTVGETVVETLTDRHISFGNKQRDGFQATVVSRRFDRGGNAWNTARAVHKVLDSLQPDEKDKMRFHAFRSNELHHLPFEGVLRDVGDLAQMRVAHVIKGPNGDDPMYWSQPPSPIETGPLPDAPRVLISSSGPDVFTEILDYCQRNPSGKVFLAPGSAQVRRGIPAVVLEQIHALSCNREEAAQVAEHLDPRPEGMEWTTGDLLTFYRNMGLLELRITDGEAGVHGLHEGHAFRLGGFKREDAQIRAFVGTGSLAGVATDDTLKHCNANGCGDTRLGTELALEMLDFPLEERVTASNFIAALHTFNPSPNIANFPNEVIEAVMQRLPSCQ